MFLSPILILALLFSSCDDNSGSAEAPKGTVTISHANIKGDLESVSDGTATVKWGTTDSEFNGEGTWETPASDDITLNDVPTATKELYVQVVLAGGESAGTYKSAKIAVSFEGDAATVSTDVTFTKEEAPAEKETLTIEGSAITATGNTETGTLTLSTAPTSSEGKESAQSLIESANIAIDIKDASSPTSSVTSATLTLSEGKKLTELQGLTSLTWTDANVEVGSATYKDVKLSGDAYSGSDSWTITGITLTPAAAEEPAVTVTTIEVTGISSISDFEANKPSADAADAITLTPPSGKVTPDTAIKGKLKTDGSVEFSAVSLSASDESTLKTGWKISATWNNSSSKACTITQVEITPTYESASNKLTFNASSLEISVASD